MKAFRSVSAAVLMPDHVHIILETENAITSATKLLSTLEKLNLGQWNMPDTPPKPIPNGQHLWRQIRYVHLNPCRAGLTADPLCYEWSTYRDYLGLSWPVWPNIVDTLNSCGISPNRPKWRSIFHQRTSTDPTAHPAGTPLKLKSSTGGFTISLETLQSSVLQVMRQNESRLQKRGALERVVLVKLAAEIPSIRHRELTDVIKVSERAVSYMLKKNVPEGALNAVKRSLSEPRIIGLTDEQLVLNTVLSQRLHQ